MSQEQLELARANVNMIKNLVAASPGNFQAHTMLAEAEATLRRVEASMPQQTSGAPHAAPGQQHATLEQRVGQLEQLVRQAAAPALSEAAKVGAALLEMVGSAMTPDQAKWVQARVNSSPAFFATDESKAALGLWIDEWVAFEGAAK